jgi:hypothetical protein
MSQHDYEHTDFANDTFNEDQLKLEIAANETITAELDHIHSHEDVETGVITVEFYFSTELSGAEVTALDALVAAHQGNPPTTVRFLASSKLLNLEVAVTEPGPEGWQALGGAVTTPSFFTPNVAACLGRIVGEYKAIGSGAKLRITEDGVDSGQHELADTQGAWTKMQWFSGQAPAPGTHSYVLEGQLNGATSAAVRFIAVSLLEFC